jgi:arginyl-tRNA synthetase
VITRDLRHAIARAAAAAGFDQAKDPGLRPAGTPGQYAASIALTLGAEPRATAAALAAALTEQPPGKDRWIAQVEITGPGYLTITVTPAALAAVADNVTAAGPGCVTSDALAGVTVAAAPPGDPLAAPTWEAARAALAARLTARLAAAAGATVAELAAAERIRLTLPASTPFLPAGTRAPDQAERRASGPRARSAPSRAAVTSPAAAAAFAGRDAVMFTLARAIPGRPLRIDPEIIARHVPGNPAYAVRYAHARAASGVRWAVISREGDPPHVSPLSRPAGTVTSGDVGVPPREETAPPCPPADPGELALLDALSWLPERVATAARRGRPDEFARYLEDLASVTVDVLSSASRLGSAVPASDRLGLAMAARTGIGAGLGLLEMSAPDRL